jgi:hypothetical protein
MTKFMQEYSNNNIAVVNILHRYMDRNSVTNLEIQAFNRKLNKMIKIFSHVAVVETDSHRKYFTQHGRHRNKSGKEWLSKLIATQICRLVKSKNRDVSEITLNWKDESADKQNTVNVHTKPKISPDQDNNSQTQHTKRVLYVEHRIDRRRCQSQETMIFYGNSNFRQTGKFNSPAIKRR